MHVSTELALTIALVGVGGVALGAAVAGGFALLSSKLESNREHARWEREKRYGVYQRFLSQSETYLWAVRAGTMNKIDDTALLSDLQATLAEFHIVGPDELYDVASKLHEAAGRWLEAKEKQRAGDLTAAVHLARRAYVNAAREALRFRQ